MTDHHVPAATAAEPKEHPDAAYIKTEDLGLVIAKGLAVLYKTQPSNPVDFLAKWLLNYSTIQTGAVAALEEQKQKVTELREKQDYNTTIEKKKKEKDEAAALEKEGRIKAFFEKTIGQSNDLND